MIFFSWGVGWGYKDFYGYLGWGLPLNWTFFDNFYSLLSTVFLNEYKNRNTMYFIIA